MRVKSAIIALVAGTVMLTSCQLDSASVDQDAAGEAPVAGHSVSTTVETTDGMSYAIDYRVGEISTERSEEAPNRVNVTASLDGEVRIKNTTEGFAADIDVRDLDASAYLPSLAFDLQEIELRSNGVGKEAAFRLCDEFLSIERFTLGPGEEEICAASASVTFEGLSPEDADAAEAALQGALPVAMRLAGDGMDWAQPADSTSEDSIKGDRMDQCGVLISQWLSGGPFCWQYRSLTGVEPADFPFSGVVGTQERPVLSVVEIDDRDQTRFALDVVTEYNESVDVSLDLIRELPEECEVTRTEARDEVSNLWTPNQPIKFLISDPEYRGGFAFPADAQIHLDPVSINEELVEKGLWVPWEFFRNPDFDPRKKVTEARLPYRMPEEIPEDWTYLRKHYAPRIVDLANEAALKRGVTATANCLGEIRILLLEQDEERERFRREAEEDRRNWRPGRGGGSFNIPGWLCPTRWC